MSNVYDLLNGIFLFEWIAINLILYLTFRKGLHEKLVVVLFTIFNLGAISTCLIGQNAVTYYFILSFIGFTYVVALEGDDEKRS
jgi:hypothetical protein